MKVCKEELCPAIKEAMPWATAEVRVQMDGAKPHPGKDNLAKLNDFGSTFSPKIVFIVRPPQSPETTVLEPVCVPLVVPPEPQVSKVCTWW